MIILGLILLIAAGAGGLDLIWKNHYPVRSPVLFGQTLGIHSAAVLFFAGAIAGAVLIAGIALILAGLRRKGTQARQHRRDRREAKDAGRDRDEARQENEKLRDRLDHDDTGSSAAGATAQQGEQRRPGQILRGRRRNAS